MLVLNALNSKITFYEQRRGPKQQHKNKLNFLAMFLDQDHQAVRVDNTIYISGSLGLDPKSGELKAGIKEQTHQSLKNIGEILKAAGVGYGNVVKTTVLLANIDDFTTVNDIYKEYFTA
ncbi:unnamed protein product, partial [Cylicostephanus goldi]